MLAQLVHRCLEIVQQLSTHASHRLHRRSVSAALYMHPIRPSMQLSQSHISACFRTIIHGSYFGGTAAANTSTASDLKACQARCEAIIGCVSFVFDVASKQCRVRTSIVTSGWKDDSEASQLLRSSCSQNQSEYERVWTLRWPSRGVPPLHPPEVPASVASVFPF